SVVLERALDGLHGPVDAGAVPAGRGEQQLLGARVHVQASVGPAPQGMPGPMESESRKTVLVALGANAGIALAKLVAGIAGGSSAMLAEGAHSIADTTNQLFLLGALRFAEREPDEQHPFGYGKERFVWTFMA